MINYQNKSEFDKEVKYLREKVRELESSNEKF
jgi:hypothetical protein